MTDFTIANEFTLPSLGKVYHTQINPQIKLRSMTTADEMKRLNHSDKAYKQLSEVMDDCILSNLGISAYDLCIPDYQFLMHKLRTVTYGPAYNVSTRCPFCLTDNEHVIDLENDLELTMLDEDTYNKYSNITLPVSKVNIKLQMQSPRILDEVSSRSKEIKKSSKNAGDPAFLITLVNLIDTINGKKYEDFELEEFISKLQMADTNYILKAAQKLNTCFGLNNDVTNTCAVCGLDYINSFRVTSEFFGPSIDL